MAALVLTEPLVPRLCKVAQAFQAEALMAMIMYLFAVAITEAPTAYRGHHGSYLRFE